MAGSFYYRKQAGVKNTGESIILTPVLSETLRNPLMYIGIEDFFSTGFNI